MCMLLIVISNSMSVGLSDARWGWQLFTIVAMMCLIAWLFLSRMLPSDSRLLFVSKAWFVFFFLHHTIHGGLFKQTEVNVNSINRLVPVRLVCSTSNHKTLFLLWPFFRLCSLLLRVWISIERPNDRQLNETCQWRQTALNRTWSRRRIVGMAGETSRLNADVLLLFASICPVHYISIATRPYGASSDNKSMFLTKSFDWLLIKKTLKNAFLIQKKTLAYASQYWI